MTRQPASPTIRIGISGWSYPGWRGTFYPSQLPQRAELDYAASRFSTIEVNGTFYSLQRASSFRSWRDRTPADFVFALKGSRFITHMKQLNDPGQALANFFGQGVLELGEKLGPVLWQFSPRFRYRPERIEPFLSMLPGTQREAGRRAAHHDHRVKDPTVTAHMPHRPIRHAMEIRHESFLVPEFTTMLRRYGVALVVSATAGEYPLVEEVTTDFMYVRLHGAEAMYAGSYSDGELDHWARRIRGWARDRDVFVYFDNDQKTRAPFDARRLMERLGLDAGRPGPGTTESLPS
ncbi:MAG TPA: DUF72 domain-containing protein [Longimicrobiales bacterium]|nr:DUF72 domain-containing protein [Longimicrobiales bacterium]